MYWGSVCVFLRERLCVREVMEVIHLKAGVAVCSCVVMSVCVYLCGCLWGWEFKEVIEVIRPEAERSLCSCVVRSVCVYICVSVSVFVYVCTCEGLYAYECRCLCVCVCLCMFLYNMQRSTTKWVVLCFFQFFLNFELWVFFSGFLTLCVCCGYLFFFSPTIIKLSKHGFHHWRKHKTFK